jgi:plasmid stability protein
MATLTIRRLSEALVRRIKARAAQAGHSMEKEVRDTLARIYGESEQLARQRQWAKRQLDRLARGEMPKSDGESAEIIRQMREERDSQVMDAIEGRSDRRR